VKIHEYQAKAILARHGVPVPRGEVAFSVEEAGAIARRLGGGVTVVKAQIHAGGRGKGGGVKVVKDAAAAEEMARQILGMTLVTHQTGPEGRKVERLLVEEGVKIAKELYLGLLVDRAAGCPVMMASAEGGMDIEEVAEKNPDAIKKVAISPITGLTAFQARQLAFGIGLAPEHVNKAVKVMQQIYEAFVATDASLIEVNPLIVTEGGDVIALDAKVTFDDNAMYRHQEFRDLRDLAEEDPLEIEASKFSLNYIRLDGTIGCMVNGAGLAMATMDIIKLVSDKNVKAVLINIFGGILRCDVLAEGVIAAVKDLGVPVPIVIRMEGTNVEQGKAMLRESGLNFTTADTMGEAADTVVALAR
jgi:succinyl-CoA synthetase beta subunit